MGCYQVIPWCLLPTWTWCPWTWRPCTACSNPLVNLQYTRARARASVLATLGYIPGHPKSRNDTSFAPRKIHTLRTFPTPEKTEGYVRVCTYIYMCVCVCIYIVGHARTLSGSDRFLHKLDGLALKAWGVNYHLGALAIDSSTTTTTTTTTSRLPPLGPTLNLK